MKSTFRALILALLLTTTAIAQPTALDRYVNQKDSVYGWKLISTIPGDGYKAFVLELTSQTWRTEKDVDRPVWKHWMTLVRPDQLKSSKGFLYITGGRSNNPAP